MWTTPFSGAAGLAALPIGITRTVRANRTLRRLTPRHVANRRVRRLPPRRSLLGRKEAHGVRGARRAYPVAKQASRSLASSACRWT
jgi:hypothetical protein